MLPIADDNSDRVRTPIVNYLLIAINIFVFIYLQGMGHNTAFTYSYSTIPAEILSGHDIVKTLRDESTGETIRIGVTNIPVWLTLITSMFMHGGWAHLGGNMLYLWIFGDNIENRLGHFRYLIFYLLVGVIASLSYVFAEAFLGRNLFIPSLGASGAISGVLGAYILLYPTRRVTVFFGFFLLAVPAIVVLGLWIAFQVLSGLGTLGGQETGGVAYAAHIGGFFAGLILVKFFDQGEPVMEQTYSRRRRYL